MIVNPRGWRTSEAWVSVAGVALNFVCQLLAADLNQPGFSATGRDALIVSGLYLLCRTLLKSIATVTGQAIPATPPAPISVQTPVGKAAFIDAGKTPAFSAQGGDPNGSS